MKLNGQRNQCPTCNLYFNSNGAFDKHRIGSFAKGERRCMTVDEMLADGMVLPEDGFWVGSLMPQTSNPWGSRDAKQAADDHG